MFIQKKSLTQSTIPPAVAAQQAGSEPFEVDLREALASTRVSELSYEDFRRALEQQASSKPQ
jgi:hypothetical protein